MSALTVLGVVKLQFVELKVLFCGIVPVVVHTDPLLCVVLLALLVFGENSFALRCQGLPLTPGVASTATSEIV